MPFFFPRGKETLFEAISNIRKQNTEMDQLELLVNTACRIRPSAATEKRENRILEVKPVMRLMEPQKRSLRCDFDGVNDQEDFQKRICDRVLNGDNVVVIAYGQTGSGKTYGILGEPGFRGPSKGLIARCAEFFLSRSGVSMGAAEVFGTKLSEIKTFDVSGDKTNELKNLGNLAFTSVDSENEVSRFLQNVQGNLHLFSTAKSAKSSRGHVIYQLSTGQSKLTVVDLAGSDTDTAFTADYQDYTDNSVVQQRKRESVVLKEGLKAMVNLVDHVMKNGKMVKSELFGANTEIARILLPLISECTVLEMLYFFAPGVNDIEASKNTLRLAKNCAEKSRKQEAETRFAVIKVMNEDNRESEVIRNAAWSKQHDLQQQVEDAIRKQEKIELETETMKLKYSEFVSDVLHMKKRNEVLKKQIAEQIKRKETADASAKEFEAMHKPDVVKIKDMEVEQTHVKNHYAAMEKDLQAELDKVKKQQQEQENKNKKTREVNGVLKKENKMLMGGWCSCLTYAVPSHIKSHL